jgi:hypothetical protein
MGAPCYWGDLPTLPPYTGSPGQTAAYTPLLEICDFFTTLLYGGEYSLRNPARAHAKVAIFIFKIKEIREFVAGSQTSKEI